MEGRVRSARRADTRPFSQILSEGTEEDNDRTFSVASPPRTSRKGRKGGSGRARVYAEIPEYDNLPKPKQAMNQQHREHMARKRQLRDRSQASHGPAQRQPRAAIAYAVNAVDLPQQQYPSNSGEESPATCWSFVLRLCRCCAKRLFRRGSTRQVEEDRLRELRLLEEERRVMELQRQFQEIRRRMDRRLEKAATKYEMKERKREEEKKEQRLLQEEVQEAKYDNEAAAAAGQLSRGMTKQEMKKELKRLQKLERNLSVRLQRLEERQGMSAPAPWTSTTDDDEVAEVMETHRHLLRTKQQQQMTTTSREIERMAAMARSKREKGQHQDKWSRPLEEREKERQQVDNSVVLGQWELDRLRQHQLELQRQEMEHRLAVEKAVQLNRHKGDMREMESQWKLEDDVKEKTIEQHRERQREMAKRVEGDLFRLIEQQQQKYSEKIQNVQNVLREAEPWKVRECLDAEPEPEPQRQTNGENSMKQQLENTVPRAENRHPMDMQIWLKMQEDLKAIKHKFKMEGNMEGKRLEKRWKRMEGKWRRECEKKVLELDRTLVEEKQQQVVLKQHKEQKNIAKEALARVETQTKPEKKEIVVGKETGEERTLEKVENITREAFTQVEIPSKPGEKEKMTMEETNEKTGLVKEMTTECFERIVDKREDTEVDFQDGQNIQVESQSYIMKDNEIQEEEKPVMEKEQPTQGSKIITIAESEESLKHAPAEPEDTPPQIENKVSVHTGGEENRSHGENEQPKQATRQKNCVMEWLTDYRQKREQERNGSQPQQTETNNIIMVTPTRRNVARQADADKRSKNQDAKQVMSMGMDWLCDENPEKDLLHSGCQVRPVVAGRRQRTCEPAAEKTAQLELVEHKDLEDDDWFGDMAVKNRENKQAEINRRRQQSRQESMLMLQGLVDQPEKTKDEDNKGMSLRSRHATTRHAKDADEEGWLLEVKKQDTKQTIFSQRSHQKMDWLCESKTKQLLDSESVTAAATVVAGRRRIQESTIENTETPQHKKHNDNWLSNINKEDKRADMNSRHQQNREESRHEPPKKQIDLTEQTAKSDKIMAVAPKVRNPVNKKIDVEVNKQEMEWPNTSEEWWSELRGNNQRKLMGNQRKQEMFGVHVSKPKEQARELERQRTKPRGLLDNTMSYTQLKKSEDALVDEKTKVPEKAAAMTWLDNNNKQSQIAGTRQTTDSWFGEWLKTKKCDNKNPDEVKNEKDRRTLRATRCPPSSEDHKETGNVEAPVVTNALMMSEVQDKKTSLVTAAERVKINGRSGLWDSLKGELLIQPSESSWKQVSPQLDFGDIALCSTKRKVVVSPLQQTMTPGPQRASTDRIQDNKTKFVVDDDDGLESITLEEDHHNTTTPHNTTPKRTNTLVDANEKPRVLLNKPTDMAKENRQVEHASHKREQEAGEAHKDVSAKEVEGDKLLHDGTEEHLGTLEKSPSLVNLLACSSDASAGEEGDGRSEAASSQHEIADVDYENVHVNDKSVRRRVLKWMNKKAKNYYSKRIEKTFKREQEEGDELYAPWFSTDILLRSEREQKKRKALVKAEEMRQRLESSLLKWEAKRAQKRALRMEEAHSLDREPDDLWFCEDLL